MLKFGNVEKTFVGVEELNKCSCKTKPVLITDEGVYLVSCPKCNTKTAEYETMAEATLAWQNKILL